MKSEWGGMEVGMKSLLLVDSRIMLLDCMYCSIASLITGEEGGRMDIGDEVIVVSGDCMCPFTLGFNIGTTFTGTVHVHLS